MVGPLYCDASALAKLFLPEAGSDALNRMLDGRSDVILADLAITEVASALARRVREGALPPAQAQRAHRKILATAAEGGFRRVDLLATTHRDAERLLFAHREAPLRAADALHLALALGAGAGTVLTFDRTLARAAVEAGLAAWPPWAP
jgi:predicted nucleic acid-binding protein